MQANITITLVPPGLYEPQDQKWQKICKKFYDDLNASLNQEKIDVVLEPTREERPKSGEWFDLFHIFFMSFGGQAALLVALKYLFDKLIELQKDKRETERAKEIEISIGEKSFKFKAIDPQEIKHVMKQIEEALPSNLIKLP